MNKDKAMPTKLEMVTDAPARDARPELTDDELSKVSGGRLSQACVKGAHIKQGTITC
jgi:bacteriocin-like protein